MVIGNECINVNIFGIVYAKYADNMLGVHTSLGRSVVAYNLDPSEELQTGERVGIIQTGDTFCVFREGGKPLRQILAIQDEATFAELDKWQYFAAKIGIKANKIKRLYRVGKVAIAGETVASINADNGRCRIGLAPWVRDLEVGDTVLIDVDMNKVVGYAGKKEVIKPVGYVAMINKAIEIPVCDEDGNLITDEIQVGVIHNSKHSEGAEYAVKTAFGGYFWLYGFLPDTIVLDYEHARKRYHHKIVLDDNISPFSGIVYTSATKSAGSPWFNLSGEVEQSRRYGEAKLTGLSLGVGGNFRDEYIIDNIQIHASNLKTSITSTLYSYKGITFNAHVPEMTVVFRVKSILWWIPDLLIPVKCTLDVRAGANKQTDETDKLTFEDGTGHGNIQPWDEDEEWRFPGQSASLHDVRATATATLKADTYKAEIVT